MVLVLFLYVKRTYNRVRIIFTTFEHVHANKVFCRLLYCLEYFLFGLAGRTPFHRNRYIENAILFGDCAAFIIR